MAKKKQATCVICGKQKADYQFITHRNANMSKDFGFCKDCVKDMYDNGTEIIDLMRMLNIPYIESVWDIAYEKEEHNPIGKYLQLIAPKKAYRTFSDSEYTVDYGDNENGENPQNHFVVTDEMIERWGKLDNDYEYVEREQGLNDLTKLKKPATLLEEKRYIENVRLGQRVRSEIDHGKPTDIKALKATYTQDLKELGLDIENSKSKEKTVGQKIEEFEKNAPIPDIGEEFNDVDRIMYYITKFMFLPMKKMFNQATDDDIQNLYSVDDPELSTKNKKV